MAEAEFSKRSLCHYVRKGDAHFTYALSGFFVPFLAFLNQRRRVEQASEVTCSTHKDCEARVVCLISTRRLLLLQLLQRGVEVLAAKISSPWTPASSGPPADTNGSGSESKHLDVGDVSE
ncbi:hypothetical protein B566_EDAN012675, partial [Ephemera danica]